MTEPHIFSCIIFVMDFLHGSLYKGAIAFTNVLNPSLSTVWSGMLSLAIINNNLLVISVVFDPPSETL